MRRSIGMAEGVIFFACNDGLLNKKFAEECDNV